MSRDLQQDISDAIQRARRVKPAQTRRFYHDDEPVVPRAVSVPFAPPQIDKTVFVRSGSNALKIRDAIRAERAEDAYLESTNKWFRLVLSVDTAEMALYAQSLKLWAVSLPREANHLQVQMTQNGVTISSDRVPKVWSTESVTGAEFVRLNKDGSLIMYDANARGIASMLARRVVPSLNPGERLDPGYGILGDNAAMFVHPSGRSLVSIRMGSADVGHPLQLAPFGSKDTTAFQVGLDKVVGSSGVDTYTLVATSAAGTRHEIGRAESRTDVALHVGADGALIIRDASGRTLWTSVSSPSIAPCSAPSNLAWSGCECDTRVQRRANWMPGCEADLAMETQACVPKENECRTLTHAQLGMSLGVCSHADGTQRVCLKASERTAMIDVRPAQDASGRYALFLNTQRKFVLPDTTLRVLALSVDDTALGSYVYAWTFVYRPMQPSNNVMLVHIDGNLTWYVGFDVSSDTLVLTDSIEQAATWKFY